jgi:hypothetical protein
MIAGFILAFTLIYEPVAHADEDNQLTKVSFSQAVQVPGHVLSAGSYQFVLVNNDANRDIVRIFNADRTKLIATIQTVPTERQGKPTGPQSRWPNAPTGSQPLL